MEEFQIFNSPTTRGWLNDVAQYYFDKIVELPKEIRSDDKERTGIKYLIREIGTRNLILDSVGKPSEAAQFFAIEKAVRSETLGHATSQNSADPDKMKFPGSVTMNYLNKTFLQCSVSGLKGEEDVFVAVVLLANAFKVPVSYVIEMVELSGGELPWQFKKEGHYLYDLLQPLLKEA
jgi:hypothetical protein